MEGPTSELIVRVDVKLFLEGPLNATTGLMNDALRVNGLVPLQEPYTPLGMPQYAGGGNETTSAAVLAITGNNAVVDWIRLELRSATNPANVVATRQALLLRNGEVVMGNGSSEAAFNVAPGSYYLAVVHRNHLSIMTQSSLALSATPVTIDLRAALTPVYGSAARKTIGSWRALWAGDISMDGLIKYVGNGNDRDIILTVIGGVSPTNTVTGYRRADVNMDGVVRYTGVNNDRDIILTNIGGVIPTQVKVQQMP
ncbi:MAG: hypothetical protein M3R08_01095 [Bacteroidota bacterium]|nr:hypothetical protein [Bacteroidota bacterium]